MMPATRPSGTVAGFIEMLEERDLSDEELYEHEYMEAELEFQVELLKQVAMSATAIVSWPSAPCGPGRGLQHRHQPGRVISPRPLKKLPIGSFLCLSLFRPALRSGADV